MSNKYKKRIIKKNLKIKREFLKLFKGIRNKKRKINKTNNNSINLNNKEQNF